MKYLILIMAMLCICSSAFGKPISETITYQQGGKTFKSLMVYDDALKGPVPGILVVHEWWGLNDFARNMAMKIADLGYVAFAVDMYGDGMTTTDAQIAAKLSNEVKGTPLIRTRAEYALALLKKNPHVDAGRVGAIGFCFGGTTVLELAWSGADLAGVVSFHGGLTSPKPEDMDHIIAKVLILQGAADPFAPRELIGDVQNALEKANVDWQMILYGGAMHSFTNPNSDSFHIKGVGYNQKAAYRSWQQMKLFFQEIFAPAEH